jgi:hypothetical protein
MVGLAALGVLTQSWLGHVVRDHSVGRQWTVHGRASVWARGRWPLEDPTGRLGAAVRAAFADGICRLGDDPPSTPAHCPAA